MITVSMLAKIRRMHFRDGVPLRDIARQTGLSRNTIRRWLREPSTGEPKYAKRVNSSVIDPWSEQLRLWLVADTRRPRRERRSATQMYEDLRAAGYDGSYDRVSAFVRNWKKERDRGRSAARSCRSPSNTAKHSSSTGVASTCFSAGSGDGLKSLT